MRPGSVLRHPVLSIVATREDLASARADNRMSAYVYGDVLVLAATAAVYDSAIRSGEALLVVLGTVNALRPRGSLGAGTAAGTRLRRPPS